MSYDPPDIAELQQTIADWEQCGELVMAAIGLPGKLLSDSDVIGELKALQYSVAGKQQRIDLCESLIDDQQKRIIVLESLPDKMDELAVALKRVCRVRGKGGYIQLKLYSDGDWSCGHTDGSIRNNGWAAAIQELNQWCDEHEQTPEQKQAERDAEDVAMLKPNNRSKS